MTEDERDELTNIINFIDFCIERDDSLQIALESMFRHFVKDKARSRVEKKSETKATTGPGSNTGHGHVWARPDGQKTRCGGPAICGVCSKEHVNYANHD